MSKKDGSIYILVALAKGFVGQGISPPKMTYHPDGRHWITSEFVRKVVGDSFLNQANGYKIDGLSIKNDKIYIKGARYKQGPSFDSLESQGLIVSLGAKMTHDGISYKDMPLEKRFTKETNPSKHAGTYYIAVEEGRAIKVEFYLTSVVDKELAAANIGVPNNGALVMYEHGSRKIYVAARVSQQ